MLLSVLYRWLHLQVDEENDSNSTDPAQPAARQEGSTGGQHNDTLTRVHQIVIQSSLVKWHKSAVRNPSLLKSGVFVFNLQKWMEVERESAYHTTPILKFLNDGHSNHPNLNHINTTGIQSFFLYFSSALFNIRNPALLAPRLQQRIHSTKLPSWTICFSPETLNVTKRIFLS